MKNGGGRKERRWRRGKRGAVGVVAWKFRVAKHLCVHPHVSVCTWRCADLHAALIAAGGAGGAAPSVLTAPGTPWVCGVPKRRSEVLVGSRAAEPHAHALKEEILSFVEVFAEVRVCRVLVYLFVCSRDEQGCRVLSTGGSQGWEMRFFLELGLLLAALRACLSTPGRQRGCPTPTPHAGCCVGFILGCCRA